MKKITFIMVLMLGILTISAQEKQRDSKDTKHKTHRKKGGKKGMHKMAKFTPEQIAVLQTKRMTLALDLSDAQQSKIEMLNLKNAELIQQKREERKDKKEHSKLSPEKKYAQANAKLDHQIKHKRALQKILSKDQYAQWSKMHKRKSHSLKKRGTQNAQDKRTRINRDDRMEKREKTMKS
ncbi:hypothetical protein M4I21_13735 [Cellulophaga sp. 20_2_10]|uniref:hypothetical protein n=1 Tax=Cellulophaga sp. 20_2_10 TaxID=2942476 RepID=UPI00201A654E|nr:hypothetical protein [Cellulophaga sp. 20_2_10]MCL5246879.1 hypothetical protein [Cellulophaga sp. 20_2_10]